MLGVSGGAEARFVVSVDTRLGQQRSKLTGEQRGGCKSWTSAGGNRSQVRGVHEHATWQQWNKFVVSVDTRLGQQWNEFVVFVDTRLEPLRQ